MTLSYANGFRISALKIEYARHSTVLTQSAIVDHSDRCDCDCFVRLKAGTLNLRNVARAPLSWAVECGQELVELQLA